MAKDREEREERLAAIREQLRHVTVYASQAGSERIYMDAPLSFAQDVRWLVAQVEQIEQKDAAVARQDVRDFTDGIVASVVAKLQPEVDALRAQNAALVAVATQIYGATTDDHPTMAEMHAPLTNADWTPPSQEVFEILARKPSLPEPGTLVSRVVLEKVMERHWADYAKLREENDKLRKIVERVAEADNSDNSVCYQLCSYDMRWTDNDHQVMTHNTPCVVEQARVLLAEQ